MKINATERALGSLGYQPPRLNDAQRANSSPSVKAVEADKQIQKITQEAGLSTSQTVIAKERAQNTENTRNAQEKSRASVRVQEKQAKNEARDEERVETEQADRRYEDSVKGSKVNVLA